MSHDRYFQLPFCTCRGTLCSDKIHVEGSGGFPDCLVNIQFAARTFFFRPLHRLVWCYRRQSFSNTRRDERRNFLLVLAADVRIRTGSDKFVYSASFHFGVVNHHNAEGVSGLWEESLC